MKKEVFVFEALSTNLAELEAMHQSDFLNPFEVAALTVVALANYKNDREATHAMLDYLRGPKPLSNYEKQFLRDRLVDKYYKPFSYFKGAVVDNNYQPDQPYTIEVFETVKSYENDGYLRLNVKSSGADTPREIVLRLKSSTKQWFLWEEFLLADIRIPSSENPWY